MASSAASNWSRPASEINELMGLLRRFIRNDLAELHSNNVRVRVIGEREGLDPEILNLLNDAEELTRNNTGLVLVVAFNYGARQEIARAAQRLAFAVRQGKIAPEEVTAELIGQHCDDGGIAIVATHETLGLDATRFFLGTA